MRKRNIGILVTIVIVIILLVANFVIQISAEQSYNNMGTDSGTFAYCGQVIHDGGLMYRDCWDNKPPGVYYLNAAAISLGGANPFAIWLFQAAWLSVALIAFFLILNQIWANMGLAALGAFTMLFFVLYPGIFTGGNLTETYALLPIILGFGAYWGFLKTGRRYWLVGLGICCAAGFLLKPTYIAIGLASGMMIAYLHLRKRSLKRLVMDLAVLAIAAAIPLVIVGLYWAIRGDFRDLWFAVFTHNFTYVEEGFSLKSLYGTLRMFFVDQPMSALSILAGVAGGVFLYNNRHLIFSSKPLINSEIDGFTPGAMDRESAQTWFMGGVFLSVIFDAVFLASSGKNFGHYLQVMIPGTVMAFVYLINELRKSIIVDPNKRGMQVAVFSAVLILLFSGGLEIAAKEKPSLQQLKAFLTLSNHFQYQPTDLEQYIIDNSTAEDSVLIWAGHPGFNFVTHRRSPTKYIFLLHLFNPTPDGPNGFHEFIQELANDPPKLIVTQPVSSIGLPNFEMPEGTLCPNCDPGTLEEMLAFKRFVMDNYELKFSIWDWEVYKRKN